MDGASRFTLIAFEVAVPALDLQQFWQLLLENIHK
jgi:hypothetical protein